MCHVPRQLCDVPTRDLEQHEPTLLQPWSPAPQVKGPQGHALWQLQGRLLPVSPAPGGSRRLGWWSPPSSLCPHLHVTPLCLLFCPVVCVHHPGWLPAPLGPLEAPGAPPGSDSGPVFQGPATTACGAHVGPAAMLGSRALRWGARTPIQAEDQGASAGQPGTQTASPSCRAAPASVGCTTAGSGISFWGLVPPPVPSTSRASRPALHPSLLRELSRCFLCTFCHLPERAGCDETAGCCARGPAGRPKPLNRHRKHETQKPATPSEMGQDSAGAIHAARPTGGEVLVPLTADGRAGTGLRSPPRPHPGFLGGFPSPVAPEFLTLTLTQSGGCCHIALNGGLHHRPLFLTGVALTAQEGGLLPRPPS